MNLLIVNDEARQIADITSCALQAGFSPAELISARTAMQALELIHNCDFSMAVHDINLAGDAVDRSGIDLIHAHHVHSPKTIIVAFTGYGDTDTAIRALSAGASDVVSRNWLYINGFMLLEYRLQLWRNFVQLKGSNA